MSDTKPETITITSHQLDELVSSIIAKSHPETEMVSKDDLETVVTKTVEALFMKMGVDHTNPLELQQDFARLREWRLASEKIKSKSVMALLGIVLAGMCAAFWVGFKIMVGKVP